MERSDEPRWVGHAVRLGATVGAIIGVLGGLFPVLVGCVLCCCPLAQLLGPALSLKAFLRKRTGPALQSSQGVLYGALWGAMCGVVGSLVTGVIEILLPPQAHAERLGARIVQMLEMLGLEPEDISDVQERLDAAIAQQADAGVGEMMSSTLVNMFGSGALWGVLGAISGLIYMMMTSSEE